MAALALMLVAATAGWTSTARAQTENTPQVSSTGPYTVAEGSVKVAQMTASDFSEDAEDLLWSILTEADSGADGDKFKLRIDHVLEFVEPPDFENHTDSNADGTYEVTVKVSDGADTDPVEATANISVTVSDVGFTAFDESTLAVDFDEHRHLRVATLDAGDPVVEWSLSGSDAGWFRIAGGVLRFRSQASGGPPDFEAPGDSDADNVYEVTVAAEEDSTDTDTTDASTVAVSVTIQNVDEPGAVELSDSVPAIGAALTASVTDPDGGVSGITWQWERSAGRSAWEAIDAAAGATYTPTAADSEDYLRVTATYTDAHGAGKTAQAVTSSPPLGELLSSLSVATSSSRQMYPAFDPKVLHYAVGCHSEVTLSLSAASADARVSVDGVQQSASNAAVTVEGLHDGDNGAARSHHGPDASDIEIVVSDADGSSTTYVVHCIHDDYPEITPVRNPSSVGIIEDLILLHLRPGLFPSIVDNNGVPRFHRHTATVGPFFRVGQVDGRYRYAWAQPGSSGRGWVVLDEHFNVLDDQVTTASPLKQTNGHDFRILDNGNYLLMSYEPAYRDLSFMKSLLANSPDPFPSPELISDPSRVLVDDTAIQIITPRKPDGEVLFNWNSFDAFDLRDCTNHRFPHDYAHGNSLQWWESSERDQDWVVVSLRGCSAVALIDADTEETVAKIGLTNLSAEEWAAAGKDPPLTLLDDPHHEFCGNHAAWMQPHEHLVLFDNGNACVTDPRTGQTLTPRPSDGPDRFSRVVEYALDLDNGEAVFVRHHSLHGEENREGRSSGHVDVLANGDWLIGWGRAYHDTNPDTAWPPDEAVTQADPDTGEEKFALKIVDLNGPLLDTDGNGDTEREQIRVRPVPLSPVALARNRLDLEASFAAASGHTSGFFTSAQARPTVVVSFNRPVVDFDETTTSITVSGGSLESVAPHVVAGEPAHSYLLTLIPDGEADITVEAAADQACDAGGVCAADGLTLSKVPSALRVRYSDPPEIDADSLTWDVDENTTDVGRLSATDDDTSTSQLMWSPVSGAPGPDDDHFALSSAGMLSLLVGKDFEAPDDANTDGTYEVMVQVSDGDSTVAALVEVTLVDVDEAPTLSGTRVVSHNENDTSVVSLYSGVDPEGDPVVWSLSGPDAPDFEIAGGVLTFAAPPDFEARRGSAGGGNQYRITVEASDSGGLKNSLDVTVSLNDVDEAPVVSGPSSVSVAEGEVAVGSFTADDPEGDPVQWLLSGADADSFEIAGGRLRFESAPDFEEPAGSSGGGNTYAVTVEASDGDLAGTVDVTVTVSNLEEPGQVSLSSRQPQAESLLQATVTDPDRIVSTVSWLWERSADRVSWSAIAGAASADYSPTADDVGMWLRATASYDDGHGSSKSANATTGNRVRAAPAANQPPEFPDTETGQREVAENTPAGSGIGAPVAATDPDAGDQLTYTLGGDDAASLDLDAGTGQLRTKAALDHEGDPSLSVVVTATDPGGLTATQTVTVTVTDVNEAPTLTGSGVVRYPENSIHPVGLYSAVDPEGDPVSWSLSGPDRSRFTIDTAGQLSFVSAPDHEAKSLHRVNVQATDSAGNTARRDVDVNVTDIDETPAVLGDAAPSHPSGSTAAVATYSADDPENRPVQWSLSGDDAGAFSIDDRGTLRFTVPPDLDNPADTGADNAYQVTVEAYDANSTGSLDVTVTVVAASNRRFGGGGFGGGAGGDGGGGDEEPQEGDGAAGDEEPQEGDGDQELAQAAAGRFDDVDAGDFFAPAVGWMLAHGITTGCDDDSFCAGRPVDRQQFVTFLWRAAGEPEPSQPGSQIFEDVTEGGYADKAIGWAFDQGVTTGCAADENGSPRFCPQMFTIRAQIAAFLYRYTGAQHPPEPVFSDVDPDSYYGAAVAWMNAHDITTGCTQDSFCPHEHATRAHAAVFIYRIATRPQSWGANGGILRSPPYAAASLAALHSMHGQQATVLRARIAPEGRGAPGAVRRRCANDRASDAVVAGL